MPKRRLWDRLCVDAVAIVQHSRWLAPPGIRRRIERRSRVLFAAVRVTKYVLANE